MDNYDEETVEETTETPEVEETEVEEAVEEEVIDWEARAKKAEAAIIKAKSKPKTAEPKTDSKLSIFDQKAIFNANVDTQEDLDEVLDYADRKGITIAKALESPVIKATLAESAQIRTSAMAVNTGSTRRAGGTVSDERLMAYAKAGKMPDSIEDIAKLARMRIGKK